jgi:hypothetical protein
MSGKITSKDVHLMVNNIMRFLSCCKRAVQAIPNGKKCTVHAIQYQTPFATAKGGLEITYFKHSDVSMMINLFPRETNRRLAVYRQIVLCLRIDNQNKLMVFCAVDLRKSQC